VTEIAEAIDASHRAGWSIGDTAFARPGASPRLVGGRDGENVIQAEGATVGEARRNALGDARALGMLGRGRRSRPRV
jgi:hypothetical protein